MNALHQRAVLLSFLDSHRRLVEMEAQLAQAVEASPLTQYINDLSSTERKVITDYFQNFRKRMLACLEETGIPLEVRRISLRWALQCGLISLHIAVDEISPERLAGYGALTPIAETRIRQIQQELHRLLERMAAYLRQGLGQDLTQRLARLETAPVTRQTLQLLDRLITRWGLVEFRPQLDGLVRRWETPLFEIAVFGRVSSGKSSLLNRLVGQAVLPVGVMPITAVPTRLVRGERPAVWIRFTEGPPRALPLEELADYASEERNPGNQKRVCSIVVQLPAPHLKEGVVFVDTPGIGFLAQAGSAATLAYLPQCDLGVVLIDASSALSSEDFHLLRLLYEAGIPAQVVLSKADLLAPADRPRLLAYVRQQLRQHLNLEVPIHLVSTVPAEEQLLWQWFEKEVASLLAQHQALGEKSLRRKLAHLCQAVAAVLQTLLAQQQKNPMQIADHWSQVRQPLEEADAAIRQAQLRCRDWTLETPALVSVFFEEATQAVVQAPDQGTAQRAISQVFAQLLAERARLAYELAQTTQQVLCRTLERLQQAAPLVLTDSTALRDWRFRELPPPPEGVVLPGSRFRPRWAALFPCLTRMLVRRRLEKQLGPSLQELLPRYDRQLHVWLKTSLEQLRELYEAQAEVFREQLCRWRTPNVLPTPAEAQALRADLEELKKYIPAASDASPH